MADKTILNIEEAGVILGMELSEIEKIGEESFLNYFWERAKTIVLMPERIFQNLTKKHETGCKEWLNEMTCSEDAFSAFYKAMQTICNHFGWEARV